jgi:hypothetical protein
MDEALARAVRERADFVCEYCRFPARQYPAGFEIEHVIPRQHDGRTTFGNLAYACQRCNKHKGPNLAGIDRTTSRTKLVRVFNPRRHVWLFHFVWDGPWVVGRTPIGRVTVALLDMNDEQRVRVRTQMLTEGWNPDE